MHKTEINSELNIKAVAALRNEVILELTQPDRPMSYLMEQNNETEDDEQDSDRERNSNK
jgi:hypothetical protein